MQAGEAHAINYVLTLDEISTLAREGGKQQDDVSVVLEALDLSKQPKE